MLTKTTVIHLVLTCMVLIATPIHASTKHQTSDVLLASSLHSWKLAAQEEQGPNPTFQAPINPPQNTNQVYGVPSAPGELGIPTSPGGHGFSTSPGDNGFASPGSSGFPGSPSSPGIPSNANFPGFPDADDNIIKTRPLFEQQSK